MVSKADSDLAWPFSLCTWTKESILGSFNQILGSFQHPIAYVSNSLDLVSLDCPASFWVLAAVAVLIEEASKWTPEIDVEAYIPTLKLSSQESLNESQQGPDASLTNSRAPFKPCHVLHAATLLQNPNPKASLWHCG